MAPRRPSADDDAAAAVTEKQPRGEHPRPDATAVSSSSASSSHSPRSSGSGSKAARLLQRALRAGRVEQAGIRPIPPAERTNRRFFNIFTVWFSINSNILGLTFGMLGPAVYELSLRDSALVILFFCLLSTAAPAGLAVLGPKTGMRQMVQARYSFGRYAVSVPVLLNLATLTGFTVIICVVGGQCLAAVSEGGVSPAVGIVVIALLSLLVSFAGFRVLHVFETYAFLVALISIAIAAGVGGTGLARQTQPAAAPTARQVLNFGMIIASYQIPWAAIASDLTTYFDPRVPGWRVFHYTYWGLLLPTVLLMTLGAAMAAAVPNNADWQRGYEQNLVGGVLAAMLAPAGGFGKFIVVILALSLLGNTCGTFYAITLNFQTLVPWLARVPRYLFAVVVTAIVIPVAITAVDDFFVKLENLIALIGYWSAAFVAIVAAEHLAFRRRAPYAVAYDATAWCDARRLPWGAAAMAAGLVSFGLVVVCMDQVWWTGPVAETTGDIGFEVAFALAALAYLPLRYAERRWTGR